MAGKGEQNLRRASPDPKCCFLVSCGLGQLQSLEWYTLHLPDVLSEGVQGVNNCKDPVKLTPPTETLVARGRAVISGVSVPSTDLSLPAQLGPLREPSVRNRVCPRLSTLGRFSTSKESYVLSSP